jgi:hypothetical protein
MEATSRSTGSQAARSAGAPRLAAARLAGQRGVVRAFHNGSMTTGKAAQGGERPAVPRCTSCERVDQLAHVPAIYRAERTTTVVRGRVTTDYGHGGRVRGRATTVSALGAALAPPRLPKSIVVPVVLLGGAGFFEMVTVYAAVGGDPDAPGIGVFLLVPLAILAVVVWLRHRRLRDQGPAAARAQGLWHRCWYCRRCGLVTLPVGSGRVSLAGRGLAGSLVRLSYQQGAATSTP